MEVVEHGVIERALGVRLDKDHFITSPSVMVDGVE